MRGKNQTRRTNRTRKSTVGRLDLLALGLLDVAIPKYAPSVAPIYTELRPHLQAEVMRLLGPRTAHLRNLRDVIRNLAEMREQRQQRTGVTGHEFVREVRP